MPKRTTISFIVNTDDNGNRSIDKRVFVGHTEQFKYEEDKEESAVADINYLFDELANGNVHRRQLV
jgi:hypothetical protein